jgi:hypothetical protein
MKIFFIGKIPVIIEKNKLVVAPACTIYLKAHNLVQVVGFFYVEKVEAVDRMASLSRFQDSFFVAEPWSRNNIAIINALNGIRNRNKMDIK